jgi:hypothetical protein
MAHRLIERGRFLAVSLAPFALLALSVAAGRRWL